MLAPLHPMRNIRLSGQDIHTGHSSIDLDVRREALGADHGEGKKTIMLG